MHLICRSFFPGEAEILSIRVTPDRKYRFYVHYVDCNRRLDEWVDESALDLTNVRFPQKGGKGPKVQVETASRLFSFFCRIIDLVKINHPRRWNCVNLLNSFFSS